LGEGRTLLPRTRFFFLDGIDGESCRSRKVKDQETKRGEYEKKKDYVATLGKLALEDERITLARKDDLDEPEVQLS